MAKIVDIIYCLNYLFKGKCLKKKEDECDRIEDMGDICCIHCPYIFESCKKRCHKAVELLGGQEKVDREE